MLKRNLTAVVLIAIALFFLLYLRTIFVELADILFYGFMAVGAFEMYQVGNKSGYRSMPIPLLLYAVGFYPLFYFFRLTGVLLMGMIAVVAALTDFVLERKKYALNDLLYTVLILFYPMILSAAFFSINHDAGNLLGIFFLLLVTLLSDAFALFAGVLFGRKKLIEDVSPKKTVAGVFGAYFGGLVGATITMLLFDVFAVFNGFGNIGIIRLFDKLYISIPVYYALALLCVTCAIFGDLAASLLKRKMGIKDFGKIFPGHGGVMDRLDSLLFVAPVVCLFFTIYGGVIA